SSVTPLAPSVCLALSLHDALPISAVLVLPRDSMDIYVTIDEGEYYEFVNKRLWDPGVYRKNLLNEDGCDSIVILHLDVNYKEKRSEEHTSELQSRENLVCRLLLEK